MKSNILMKGDFLILNKKHDLLENKTIFALIRFFIDECYQKLLIHDNESVLGYKSLDKISSSC